MLIEAFNVSLGGSLGRAFKLRLARSIYREQEHIRNCLMACKKEANCEFLFLQQWNQLDGFLSLARNEISRFRPREIADACTTDFFSRPCVISNVPLTMCDRELWARWRALVNVTQADIDLQLAAYEPTNSSGAMFTFIFSTYGRSEAKCFVGYCDQDYDANNLTYPRLNNLLGALQQYTAPYYSDMACTMTTQNLAQSFEAWQSSWQASCQ